MDSENNLLDGRGKVMSNEKKFSRRDLLKVSAAGAAGACVITGTCICSRKILRSQGIRVLWNSRRQMPRHMTPPAVNCHVMCGYKVHIWPKGTGRKPDSEKFYPVEKMRGDWPNPVFTIEARKGGKDVNIMIVPDNKDVAKRIKLLCSRGL